MVADITMKYGDSEVLYNVRTQTWSVEGVSEAALLKIAPDKVAAINAALKEKVAEYQERIKKEAEEAEVQRKAERQAKIDAFKATVQPLLLKGYVAKYGHPEGYYDPRYVHISKENVNATVQFEPKVYGGFSSFRGRTTSSPWQMSFDYKNTRYSTIEKAIAAACKKIDARIAEYVAKETAAKIEHKKREDASEKLAKQGIQLSVETRRFQNRGRYDSYDVKMAQIVVPDPNGKKITVSGELLNDLYEVAKVSVSGKFTPEQFKKLAEAVKEIAPEPR